MASSEKMSLLRLVGLATCALAVTLTSVGCGSGAGETTVVEQPEDFKILTPAELAERNAERTRMMSGAAEERDDKPAKVR